MTKNWFLMIIWMFVAAISLVELTNNYFKFGLLHIKTMIFAGLLIASAYFVLRLRKIRNRERFKK